MKHYLKVNHNGEIIGSARTKGGFCEEHDLCNPNNNHPVTVSHRKLNARNPNFAGFVAYDCPCPSEHERCSCLSQRKLETYVEDGILRDKPVLTLLIDGVAQPSILVDDPLTLPPGTKVKVKLQGSIPDGHEVTAIGRGQAHVIPSDTALVFNAGETQELELTAPAHGTTGYVAGMSKYTRLFRVQLRGWM